MAFFKKKTSPDLEEYRDITDDVRESDFVPYACHYSPETLLTKNGELLQTIKIVGFSYESLSGQNVDLRDTLRRAVLESLNSNAYALWLHTIRSRTNLLPGGEYREEFPAHVHEKWNQRNGWSDKFTNELYITVVREGQAANPLNLKDFARSLWPKADRRYREEYLTRAHGELIGVVQKMLDVLAPFGARLLTVEKRGEVFHSGPAEFLSKIINLRAEDMPLPDVDLATFLTTQEITFGFNAMEVRSHQGRRRFGSILTLKEYKELSPEAVDRFMQLPVEFIVSQCIDFINHKQALADYQYQKALVTVSGDKELPVISGLDDILNSNQGRAIDYGEQQLSVFLLADDLRALERYVHRAVTTLSSLGIIAVREDIRFEECYWAQLPGNFEFVKRLKSINTRRIGGFANLNNFPAGKRYGNHWGEAVTLLYTAARTPYFFNFHTEDNGHTLMVGPEEGQKTLLLNFLLSESRKYLPRLFCFDQGRTSEAFIRRIGGEYTVVSPTAPSSAAATNNVPMQPLLLKDSEINRRFLLMWLSSLLDLNEETWTAEEAQLLQETIEHIYTLPDRERRLAAVAKFLDSRQPELAAKLAAWHSGGKYSSLFDHEDDALLINATPRGFDMTEVVEDEASLIPVFSYLLHRVTQALDGTPAIVVLKNAWALLDNPFYATRLDSWLEKLRKNNAMAILTVEEVEAAGASMLTPRMMGSVATQIYLPDAQPVSIYDFAFGLHEREVAYLGMMRSEEGHFLLKRGGDTIVAALNMDGMEDIAALLMGQPESATPNPAEPVAMPRKELAWQP